LALQKSPEFPLFGFSEGGKSMRKTTTSLGSMLQKLRWYRGMTQQELANITGVTVSYISQIEAGKKIPSITVIVSLEKAFRLDWISRRNLRNAFLSANGLEDESYRLVTKEEKIIGDFVTYFPDLADPEKSEAANLILSFLTKRKLENNKNFCLK
jgi:transcriptional regulator with XRE-family HTH domain